MGSDAQGVIGDQGTTSSSSIPDGDYGLDADEGESRQHPD